MSLFRIEQTSFTGDNDGLHAFPCRVLGQGERLVERGVGNADEDWHSTADNNLLAYRCELDSIAWLIGKCHRQGGKRLCGACIKDVRDSDFLPVRKD